MNDILITVGGTGITTGVALLAGFGLLTPALLIVIAVLVARVSRARHIETATQAMRAEDMDLRIGDIARAQAEAAGRLHAMHEALAARQGELAKVLGERLDTVTHRLGESMHNTTKHTVENLQKLNERLAVIDTAQRNITELASQVTSLQGVLANKQQRGAFGQGRMEIIIQDGLTKDQFSFQATLSNGKRPDACVYLPEAPALVVDAKFPLEAVTAFREAESDEMRKQAAARVRTDVSKHIADIADKYLIPGETQDIALMFVPSESIYAELYDSFDDLFQRAYRAKVIIVSPSLLMLAIQVIQQIRRDARMREAASKIISEVAHLMADVERLRDRVGALDKHFGQTSKDIEQITISVDKIVSRGERIQNVEFEGDAASADVIPAPIRKLQAGE
ncbi:DNA recombination protein RmuC [Pseudolabrys sp.]|uniref:DNA recombination protein RmuC n=1 Tax=Pseudolabrys sp. TaxID=1960880 RepID=UPI003D103384